MMLARLDDFAREACKVIGAVDLFALVPQERVLELVEVEGIPALLGILEVPLLLLDFFVDVFEVDLPSRRFHGPRFQILNVLKSLLVVFLLFNVVRIELLVDLPGSIAARSRQIDLRLRFRDFGRLLVLNQDLPQIFKIPISLIFGLWFLLELVEGFFDDCGAVKTNIILSGLNLIKSLHNRLQNEALISSLTFHEVLDVF